MSQASKSKARARERWRRQAARLIAEATVGPDVLCGLCQGNCGSTTDDTERCTACGGEGTGRAVQRPAVLRGHHFDVHAVRAYCERVVAEAKARELERVVFVDWCRDRGMGPENRDPGVFKTFEYWPCSTCTHSKYETCEDCDPLDAHGAKTRGGWPGPLARDWGSEKCEACGGRGRREVWEWAEWRSIRRDRVRDAAVKHAERDGWDVAVHEMPAGRHYEGPGYRYTLARQRLVKCKPCRGRGRVPKHGYRTDAAAGPGLARTAQRLLDTLDGRCPWAPSAEAQSSECQRCDRGWLHHSELASGGGVLGWPTNPITRQHPVHGHLGLTCPDCRGTGHNLAGVLPGVEDDQQSVAAIADALTIIEGRTTGVRNPGSLAGWQQAVYERNTERIGALAGVDEDGNPRTRSVPRGEHRPVTLYVARAYGILAWRGDTPTERIATLAARALGRDFGELFAEMKERHALGVRHLPRWRRGELRHAEQRRGCAAATRQPPNSA